MDPGDVEYLSPAPLPAGLDDHSLRRRIVQLAAVLGIVGLIAAFAPGLDELRDRLREARPGWLALAVVLELQRRNPALAANCLHPGVIRSGFAKNNGVLARIGATLAGPFLRSPESGARSLVWLALDPAAGELRGQYIEKQRPVEPSAQAQDGQLATQLWERSAKLTAPTHRA